MTAMNGRVLFPLALFAGGVYLLVLLKSILLPFILAATLAYVLNPLIVLFEVRGVRRERAVLLVYAVLLFSCVSMTYLAISAVLQSASLAAVELPLYMHRAKEFLAHVGNYAWVERLGLSQWVQSHVIQEGPAWALRFVEAMPSLMKEHLLPLIEMAFLVPFLTYFFMMDGTRFLGGLVNLVPARYVEMFLNVFVEINHAMGNYLRGLLLQAFFMGLFTGVCYGYIGLRYTVYIALWAAVSSMIPFLGPISAAVAGGLIALFQWGTMEGLVKVLAVFIVIRFLEDWFLQPVIMRRAVHMHPVMTIFSLLAGAYLAGLWGLIFAVPAVCMLKVVLDVSWQWYRTEYGPRTAPVPPEAVQIPVV
jgi:predicted PurR-regulated permease PerM